MNKSTTLRNTKIYVIWIMSEEIKIWVCPKCRILQGIEVWIEQDQLKSRCVSCGVPLTIEEVTFISKDTAKSIITEVESAIPVEFHTYVRYSWVSNKTVGLIFEFSIDEIADLVEFDPLFYFQDDLGDKYNLTITVYFES